MSKNSLFDRFFFLVLSAALSLISFFLSTYFCFIAITSVIGGTFSLGAVYIIAAISFTAGTAVCYYLFRFLIYKLLDKSIGAAFKNAIRRQQSLVKESYILDIPEEEFEGKSKIRNIQNQHTFNRTNRQHQTKNK